MKSSFFYFTMFFIPSIASSQVTDYQSYFMPGIGYAVYQPNQDSMGTYTGVTIEYLFYTSIRQNERRGPSHTRFYGKLNIMKSNKKDISSIFIYSLGLDLSLERNPKRDFLVPYFGLEFGGFVKKPMSSIVHFTPTLGIHILSTRRMFINLQTGYSYLLREFDAYKGFNYQGSFNFTLW